MTKHQLVLAAVVFAGFAGFAAWRSPVPGVNEPHYLCKARHFSDEHWCARDQFLKSADVHWVFYAAIGPVTRVLNFDQTAWLGRVVTWGLLALGWVWLAGLVIPGRFAPAWSAFLFLAIQATGNLSGEWMVGGLEAKGFSYAALIWAVAAACKRSGNTAAIGAGVSVSLHPVVGGWGVVALLAARFAGRPFQAAENVADGLERPSYGLASWRHAILPAGLCLAFTLPGLVPAVALLTNSPGRSIQRHADEIQVFDRLNHHLDPAQFANAAWLPFTTHVQPNARPAWWNTAWAAYATLFVSWLIMRHFADRSDAERFFTRFVLATLAIAAVGLAVGFGLRSPGLMKFYPFRLFDVFLPIAFSFTAAGLLERAATAFASRPATGILMFAATIGQLPVCAALLWVVAAPGRDENASRWQPENWRDFVDACLWIERNTPADAIFLTPRYNVGFKWYAQRAEYVTWKDCPQDARGIIDWKIRLDWITRWRTRHDVESFSGPAVTELARETGIDYVLSWNIDEYQAKPVYRNRKLSVYRVSEPGVAP